MKCIIGLGNPGKEYERTRHNLGFRILDAFATDLGVSFHFRKDMDADVAEGRVGREKVILVKPQTFMNRSGFAVQSLTHFFHVSPNDCWIVHDEIDLSLGNIKVQHGKSSAGHRGVGDIIRALGTQKFYRFRIGVDSRTDTERTQDANQFVMTKFGHHDEAILNDLLPRVVTLLIDAIHTTPERAISVFGKRKNGT